MKTGKTCRTRVEEERRYELDGRHEENAREFGCVRNCQWLERDQQAEQEDGFGWKKSPGVISMGSSSAELPRVMSTASGLGSGRGLSKELWRVASTSHFLNMHGANAGAQNRHALGGSAVGFGSSASLSSSGAGATTSAAATAPPSHHEQLARAPAYVNAKEQPLCAVPSNAGSVGNFLQPGWQVSPRTGQGTSFSDLLSGAWSNPWVTPAGMVQVPPADAYADAWALGEDAEGAALDDLKHLSAAFLKKGQEQLLPPPLPLALERDITVECSGLEANPQTGLLDEHSSPRTSPASPVSQGTLKLEQQQQHQQQHQQQQQRMPAVYVSPVSEGPLPQTGRSPKRQKIVPRASLLPLQETESEHGRGLTAHTEQSEKEAKKTESSQDA